MFKCKGCIAKDQEIERLTRMGQQLLASLLQAKDLPVPVQTVDEPEEIEEPAETPPDPYLEAQAKLAKYAEERGHPLSEFYDA